MNRLHERPRFAASMLGGVPYETMDKAAEVMFEHFPETLRLPVLTRSFEWISEGMPCLEVDWENSAFLMVPPEEREEEVVEFYEKVEQDDLDHFATTPNTAPFYYEMVERLLDKLEEGIDSLVQGGIDEELVAGSSWVLPSCDPVLLSPDNADLAISMTGDISRTMKKKYGFE